VIRHTFFVCCFTLAASPAFAQEAPPRDFTRPFVYDAPPAVIGPVQEPETRTLNNRPMMVGPRDATRPVEVYTPEETESPSVTEFVRSLSTECNPDRKPGDPAAPGAAPACLQKPDLDPEIIRPPFPPPAPDLHPDYGKAQMYPLAPL
jgi:hypothetical protein